MMKEKTTPKVIYFFIFIIAIAADRLSKIWAERCLAGGKDMVLIPGIIDFHYLENRGAAFGMLQGKFVFFYLFTAVVLMAILYFIIKCPKDNHYICINAVLSVIAAGAVGNFIDRVSRQYVVDFIYFKPINFPVFNVADIFVTVGCILFALLVIFRYEDSDFDFLGFRHK